MAKDSKIVAEYKVDISDAENKLKRLSELVESINDLKIEIQVSSKKEKKKWYQFWK